MKTQIFQKINNIERLSKIIYFNFIYLEDEPDINFSIDNIRETLSAPDILGWFLLNDNNKIVGYLLGNLKELPDGRYVYYISYFYIIKTLRNQGIGTKMLLSSINYVKNINVPFVMLISKINSSSYTLYNKIGFIRDPIIKLNNSKFDVLLYYC